MSLDERAARRLSVIPSVFYRLFFAFMILVSLVSASVSLLSYLYFQSIYNKELVNFHQLYLENIEKELANGVVDASKLIYMELDALLSQADSGLFAPEDGRAERASKIYTTYRALDDLVARNYDRVESISLYYVQGGLLVSSSGYDAEGSSVLRGDGRDWMRELVARDSRSAWILFRRPEYLGIPPMTLLRALRSFPILSSPQDCSIVVAIDFRESALRDIVSRLSPEDGGRTALVSHSLSDVLATQDGKGWDEVTMSTVRAVAQKATGGFASEMRELEGGESLVSLSPISDSGWYLANVVRSSRLYQRGAGIWRTILVIGLVAIGLGAALAMILTSGIYNPLERLLGRFRTLFSLPLPDKAFRTDEYRVIDDALTGLSTRMDELQATIVANRPVIGHELILRFLEGERIEAEELDETFGLLGAQPLPGRLRAVLVSLPSEGRSSRQGETVRGPVLKYRVAEELVRGGDSFILASALSGERIGLIEAARDETEEDCH
ncbi:MAG: cache domain-containing protein, partial [Spirochaetaceae bacterium]|nr:cache domain-containing protein [Spirochaetaceae bacterium]